MDEAARGRIESHVSPIDQICEYVPVDLVEDVDFIVQFCSQYPEYRGDYILRIWENIKISKEFREDTTYQISAAAFVLSQLHMYIELANKATGIEMMEDHAGNFRSLPSVLLNKLTQLKETYKLDSYRNL